MSTPTPVPQKAVAEKKRDRKKDNLGALFIFAALLLTTIILSFIITLKPPTTTSGSTTTIDTTTIPPTTTSGSTTTIGTTTTSVSTTAPPTTTSGPTTTPTPTYSLYGSAYFTPSGFADLYLINKTTAAYTLIGPIGFKRVGAIAAHPITNVLYGIGLNATNYPVLITIDTTTGVGTLVGYTGINVNGAAYDLSFRPSDNVLFCYGGQSLNTTLFTVNIITGAATPVYVDPEPGPKGNALAFNSSNVLFTANNYNLTILNQTAGATAPISTNFLTYPIGGSGGDERAAGMQFDEFDILYAAVIFNNLIVNVSRLEIIHVNNLTASIIGFLPNGTDGLAFVRN